MKSTERFELEIRENAFVRVEDETMKYFCEWKNMVPELQDAFVAMKQEAREIIKWALSSDAKIGFFVVAEDYQNVSSATLCQEIKSPPG